MYLVETFQVLSITLLMVQACLLLAAKVWSFVAYLFKKQYRTVGFHVPFFMMRYSFYFAAVHS